jgi:hypothetical protein
MIVITGWYLEFSHILIPLMKMNCIYNEFIVMVNCYRHLLLSLFPCSISSSVSRMKPSHQFAPEKDNVVNEWEKRVEPGYQEEKGNIDTNH